MKNLKFNLLLVLAAFIWGAAFVAQSAGMEYIGPFTFNGIRFIIGGITLLPVVLIRRKRSRTGTPGNIKATDCDSGASESAGQVRTTIRSGIICGCVLAVASSFQQVGIIYTSAGKAGFITALYVIMVPIFGLLLFKRRSGVQLWIGAALAVVGMYFLCLSGGMSVNKGDILVFICAIFFTLHILTVDKLAPAVDGISLSCVQFFTAGILCSLVVPFTETVSLSSVIDAAVPLLYTGVLSCGVAYTLQVVGQKRTSPVLASLLLSLESVFSVITAWIILGDAMSGREILGCLLVFAAIVLAQLPGRKGAPGDAA